MKPFLFLLSVAAALFSGCASVTPVPMESLGPRVDGPAHIASVAHDSPYARSVKPGDLVVAIDGRPVTTMQEAGFVVSAKTVEVRAAAGQIVELPGSAFLPTDTVAAAVSLFPSGQSFTMPVTSVVYGAGRVAAAWGVELDNTFQKSLFGTAFASLIPTPIRYIEVELTAEAHPKCEEQCKDVIRQSNEKWQLFVSARKSTLTTGLLRPGASKTAFLFFELPEEAHGPFVLVVLMDGAPRSGFAQFRISP